LSQSLKKQPILGRKTPVVAGYCQIGSYFDGGLVKKTLLGRKISNFLNLAAVSIFPCLELLAFLIKKTPFFYEKEKFIIKFYHTCS